MHVSLTSVLGCSLGLMMIASATPSGVGASTATPECECNVTRNDFAVSIPGQGVLTESIACTPNSPLNYCTASGNLVWTPSMSCCATTADWGTSGSGTVDSPCQNGQTVACTGATSNSHSCSVPCGAPPGNGMTFAAGIMNCSSPSTSLGAARKDYVCVIQ